jgi:hypothetical protein
MIRGARVLSVLAGLSLLGAGLAFGDGLPEIVSQSNEIIERTNQLREEAENGKRLNGEAKRAVADLLPQLDDLDARAIRLCMEQPTAEDVASVADLILHGSTLQCLYALSAKDGDFDAGLGYETVYEQFLVLTDIDFRHEGVVTDPQELLDAFREFAPPATAKPWIGNGAQAALDRIEAARRSLFEDGREPKTLLARLPDLVTASRAALDAFAAERNRDYLAAYLAGKLHTLEVCCFALVGLQNPGTEVWGRLANTFAECAQRAGLPPEAMLDLFEPPEGFADWDRPVQGWREIVEQALQNFRYKLFDNFNHRQSVLWNYPNSKRESRVTVGLERGRLVIRGRSDGRWSASGQWTQAYAAAPRIFSVEMGRKGDGYYQHLRISGDNGTYVHLACGGGWAPTTFEIWHAGQGKPQREKAFVKEASAFDQTPPSHVGEVWYDPDSGNVRAILDGVIVGQGVVNLGHTVTYAIYCSSEAPVEYDAWFDNFQVAPPAVPPK